MNTNPDFGTRLRFDLAEITDAGARYRVTVYDPDGTFETAAHLMLATGEVRLGALPEHAGKGLERGLLPFAKQILTARRSDPSGHWPRRVTRWRG